MIQYRGGLRERAREGAGRFQRKGGGHGSSVGAVGGEERKRED